MRKPHKTSAFCVFCDIICDVKLDYSKAKNNTQKLKEIVEALSNKLEEAKKIINWQNLELEQKNLELKSKDETIASLYEKLKLSLQRQFGKKSEKSDTKEIEATPPIEFDSRKITNKSEIEAADEEITVAAHTRKKLVESHCQQAFLAKK